MKTKIRPIAIHLPQFHPIPENDLWWGKGFTEWTNVAKAKPHFKNHYQPHLPSDLGFYDLRLEESRIAQAEMAKAYGIYGFCYYHYWFNGKRLLERPVDDILKTGKPDFPFMLCWANENWSRRWDGSEHLLLMEQNYCDDDARAHCRHLIPYFDDQRYIKINGKPVFVFYKPLLIPNLEGYITSFREEAGRHGVDLYLCRMETNQNLAKETDYNLFDAAIEFQPHSKLLYDFMHHRIVNYVYGNPIKRNYLKFLRHTNQQKKADEYLYQAQYHLDYQQYVDYVLANYEWPSSYKRFPGITPMWDNTARRGKKSFLFKNSTPEKYAEWLNYLVQDFKPYNKEENFLFINAWNEWAEGNHLEPCLKWGTQYLEATKKAFSGKVVEKQDLLVQ